MTSFSNRLSIVATLSASLLATQALASDNETTCTIDDGQLTINIEHGDFSGQQAIIELDSEDGTRLVQIGDASYALQPTALPGSIIEADGDINQDAMQLNDERGKGGLSHKFFRSLQQPQWQMMAIGIPAEGGSTITFETSDDGGFSKREINCSGGQTIALNI